MSIGFQKKQGVGTTAYDQLTKLSELITSTQELNYPEIYKMAKMYAPGVTLTPIVKNWSIGGFDKEILLNLNGRFFGQFQILHTHNGIGHVPAEQSEFFIYDGNDEVFYDLADKYTDGSHNRHTKDYKYIGYGSSLRLFKPRSQGVNFAHKAQIYFLGFQLGAAVPNPVVTIPPSLARTTVLQVNGTFPVGLTFGITTDTALYSKTYSSSNEVDKLNFSENDNFNTLTLTNNLSYQIQLIYGSVIKIVAANGGILTLNKLDFIGNDIFISILQPNDPFNFKEGSLIYAFIGNITITDDVIPDKPIAIISSSEWASGTIIHPRIGFTSLTFKNDTNCGIRVRSRTDGSFDIPSGVTSVMSKGAIVLSGPTAVTIPVIIDTY